MLTEVVVFVVEQDYAVLAMVKVPISTLSVVSVWSALIAGMVSARRVVELVEYRHEIKNEGRFKINLSTIFESA